MRTILIMLVALEAMGNQFVTCQTFGNRVECDNGYVSETFGNRVEDNQGNTTYLYDSTRQFNQFTTPKPRVRLKNHVPNSYEVDQ